MQAYQAKRPNGITDNLGPLTDTGSTWKRVMVLNKSVQGNMCAIRVVLFCVKAKH